MQKTVVCKINIDIDVESQPIVAATDFAPWFNDFISNVKSKAAELGYNVPQYDPEPHCINGGISKYYVFSLFEADYKLKVVVGVRFANHDSKLSKEQHDAITREDRGIPDDVPVEDIDIVQPSDVAYVHIKVDGTTVRDEDIALLIIERKLITIRDKER